MRLWVVALLCSVLWAPAAAQRPPRQPIIDVHRHASWPGTSDAEPRAALLADMDAEGIVLSLLHINEPDDVQGWIEAAPGRFIGGPACHARRLAKSRSIGALPRPKGGLISRGSSAKWLPAKSASSEKCCLCTRGAPQRFEDGPLLGIGREIRGAGCCAHQSRPGACIRTPRPRLQWRNGQPGPAASRARASPGPQNPAGACRHGRRRTYCPSTQRLRRC